MKEFAELNDIKEFELSVEEGISALGKNLRLQEKTLDWFLEAGAARYSYHFTALGLPIIQFPQDMVAVQELVWSVKPDLIIETGVARGGSLVWSAGLLAMLDFADAYANGQMLDPRSPKRRVLGIDIDIRAHNRVAIEDHPFASYIEMIQGSSVDFSTVDLVHRAAQKASNVMVFLDSNHTHDHVLQELEAYAPLVSKNSFCVVFDTMIEDSPKDASSDRSWGPGNSPKTAVDAYLKDHPEFLVDESWDHKLQITVAKGGYLRRTS